MLLSCFLKRKANRRNKTKIVIFATESFIIDRFIIEIFVVEAPGGTPGDFFNEDSEAPREVRELLEKIEMLTPEQRTLIRQVVEQFLGE